MPPWVHAVMYLSIMQIPFTQIYLPGTENYSIASLTEVVVLFTILSHPRIFFCRFSAPLLAFFGFLGLRMVLGLVLTPELAPMWWVSSRGVFRPLLWSWFLFGAFQAPDLSKRALWIYLVACASAVGMMLADVGPAQELGGRDEMRLSAFHQNANDLGLIYAVGVVIAAELSTAAMPRLRTLPLVLVALAGLGLCVVGVVLTASRNAMLLSAIGLMILLVPSGSFAAYLRRAIMAIGACALIYWAVIGNPAVLHRFERLEMSETRDEPRMRMIPVLLDIFLQSPVWGRGPEGYRVELSQKAEVGDISEGGITAHNNALLVAVETGVLGLGLFGYGLFRIAVAAWRVRRVTGFLSLALVVPVLLMGLTTGSFMFHWHFYFIAAYVLATDEWHAGFVGNMSAFRAVA